MNEVDRIWLQQEDESVSAHEAFLVFLNLGRARTILGAYRTATGKTNAKHFPGQWQEWVKRFQWKKRARAFDNWLLSHRDRISAEQAVKWERRRQEALERGWNRAQELWAKAGEMLPWPIAQQTVNSDGTITITEPVKWDFDTMVRISKVAAEIETAVLAATSKPAEEMNDAELRALIDLEKKEP